MKVWNRLTTVGALDDVVIELGLTYSNQQPLVVVNLRKFEGTITN